MSEEAGERDRGRWNRLDVLSIALLVILGASLFVMANGKRLEPIIDVGRDLYVPSALLDGTKLYRDILYFYPPFVPYLLAGWVAVAGASLNSYAAFGVMQSLLCAGALFLTGRNVGSRHTGAMAAFFFVAWSFTGASSWGSNFIFPYAHAATVGITAVVCALAALTHYLYVHRSRWSLLIMSVAISAAGWSKIEFALLSFVFMAVALFVYCVPRVVGLLWVGANIVALTVVSVYFNDTGTGHHWLWDNVLPQSLLDSPVASRFYAAVSGFAVWPQLLLRNLLAFVVVAGEVMLLGWASSRGRRGVVIAAAGSLAAGAILAFAQFFFAAWSIGIAAALFMALREKEKSPLLLLVVVSLGATWRICLRPEPIWYGFALSIPLFLLIGYVLFETLPSRGFYSKRIASLWWLVAFLATVPALSQQWKFNQAQVNRISTLRGDFFDAERDRAAAITSLLRYLRQVKGDEFVAFPEGLSLNYFARATTPMSHQTFTPIEADFPDVERAVVEELRLRGPERVVIVPRDLREFGYRGWGVDYHLAVAEHLRANYDLERTFGGRDYPIVLLKLKPIVGASRQGSSEKQNTSVQQTLQAR